MNRIKSLFIGSVTLVIFMFFIIVVYTVISSPLQQTLNNLNQTAQNTSLLTDSQKAFYSKLMSRLWFGFLFSVVLLGGEGFVWFLMWSHKDVYEEYR